MYNYSEMPKRKRSITPTEDMVNVDHDFLMDMCERKGFDLDLASITMGYSHSYLYTAIYDERMAKEHLIAMSKIMNFPYKNALVSHRKDDLYDLLF